MTPEEFTAALTERLRLQDVDFRPAELKMFVTEAWPRVGIAPDVEDWARRFNTARSRVQPPDVQRRDVQLLAASFLTVALSSPLNLFLDGLLSGLVPFAFRPWLPGAYFEPGCIQPAIVLFAGALAQTGLFAALCLPAYYICRRRSMAVRRRIVIYITAVYLGIWFVLDVCILYILTQVSP